jgi:hypothetical protein
MTLAFVIPLACTVEPPTPDVTLTVYVFDFVAECWCGQARTLDGDLWGVYATSDDEVCLDQEPWAVPTADGDCITVGTQCEGGVPDDPWLAECETLPGCCELDPTDYPTCTERGVPCDLDDTDTP